MEVPGLFNNVHIGQHQSFFADFFYIYFAGPFIYISSVWNYTAASTAAAMLSFFTF